MPSPTLHLQTWKLRWESPMAALPYQFFCCCIAHMHCWRRNWYMVSGAIISFSLVPGCLCSFSWVFPACKRFQLFVSSGVNFLSAYFSLFSLSSVYKAESSSLSLERPCLQALIEENRQHDKWGESYDALLAGAINNTCHPCFSELLAIDYK